MGLKVTAWEGSDYKANVRPKLRGMLEAEKSVQDGMSDFVVVYVRPRAAEPNGKGPKKVLGQSRSSQSAAFQKLFGHQCSQQMHPEIL